MFKLGFFSRFLKKQERERSWADSPELERQYREYVHKHPLGEPRETTDYAPDTVDKAQETASCGGFNIRPLQPFSDPGVYDICTNEKCFCVDDDFGFRRSDVISIASSPLPHSFGSNGSRASTERSATSGSQEAYDEHYIDNDCAG